MIFRGILKSFFKRFGRFFDVLLFSHKVSKTLEYISNRERFRYTYFTEKQHWHRRRQGEHWKRSAPPTEIEKIVVEKWCYFRRRYF